MIPILLLALLAADPPSSAETRYAACVKLIESDPARAVAEADAWRAVQGGLPARQCLGLAYAAQERWAPAAVAFEQAARDAEIQGDARAGFLWTQAGNAALAGDDAGKARLSFDRALALPGMSDAMQGEIWLDRARADVAAGDLAMARQDMDRAIALVPADPMAWLLSANLARRQKDLALAAKHIAEADRLAPRDAAIAYEAGNVAAGQGDGDAASAAWKRAVAADPDGPSGQAAALALKGAQPEN